MGLISVNSEAYFITEDDLKYRLPNEEMKMCITQEDAYDWVKMLHEYQLPHLIQEEILAQVHKGPYWWPTISKDTEHVLNKCNTYQITLRNEKTHDWRKPIIQYLKHPMELSDSAFHEELGVLWEDLLHYFLKERKLKRSFVNGQIKLCIPQDKGVEWMKMIHTQRDPHLSMGEMISQATLGPYWWPTIHPDIDQLCKECRICWPNKSPEHIVDCKTITIKEKEELQHQLQKGTPLVHISLSPSSIHPKTKVYNRLLDDT